MNASPPPALRPPGLRPLAVAAAVGLAGCGGGRWLTTHTFDAPQNRDRQGASLAASDPGADPAVPLPDGRGSEILPASFAPQEFGAGEEGGGLGEGGGLDPSAAPSAGPLQTDVGDAPSAGPLETDIGDAPSAGPLETGEDGDLGEDGGDLGSAPGRGGGADLSRPFDGDGSGDGAADGPGTDALTPLLPGGSGRGTGAGSGANGTGAGGANGGGGGGGGTGNGDGNAGGGPADLDRPGTGTDESDADDATDDATALRLSDVTASVLAAYPLLAEVAARRPLGDGLILEAEGAFDTKLKGSQELAPLGFYENYRHAIGVEQPLVGGADLFAGYRIGRGEFEPWYQERQTNDGGEFKAGFTVPLLRDRRIDARRAAVQVAALERAAADPAVAAVQLAAVRDGAGAYWEWVAAGRLRTVAERLLDLSLDRTEALEVQVEAGEVKEITLRDNDRLIAGRRSKVADAERKYRQAAAKLSLYLRGATGVPLVPDEALLPGRFPEVAGDAAAVDALIAEALARRPELVSLELARRQTLVSLAEAKNDLLPDLDAGLVVSQDVGALSSSKGDKQPFELDTAVVFSVPLQRRKARGKAQQLEAKLAQLTVKRRFAGDKAAVEVRLAAAALDAAREQAEQAAIGVDLAERLRAAEVRSFELGESDLFILNAREAQAAAAAEDLVLARFAYHVAAAELAAATAVSPLAAPTAPPPAPIPAPMPEPVAAPLPAPMPLPGG